MGVYGFSSTPRGNPLDSYGRNIYVDTFDSAYGKGWHRENSFLTHHRGHTLGDFCSASTRAGHPRGDGPIPSNRRRPGSDTGRDVGSDDIGRSTETVQDRIDPSSEAGATPSAAFEQHDRAAGR